MGKNTRSVGARALVHVLVVCSLVAAGCTGPASIVRRDPPPYPSAPPAPFAQATLDRWQDARDAYVAALASGFDAARCADVSARFEAASATHEGGLAEATYMIGLVRRACGDEAGASAAFHRALALRSTLCGARVAIALEAEAAGDVPAARTELERAVRDDTRCVEGYVNLARLERRDPDTADDALVDLRRALAVDARSMAAFDQMALVYLEQAMRLRGDVPRVQGGGVQALAAPGTTSTSDEAGRLLDLAGVVCRQAQLVDPDYAPLYNTWALIDVQRGEIVEALAMLERAMELDPSSFEAAMNFGELTLSFRGYADAAQAFARAAALRPSDYDAQVGLGAAQRGLGDVEAAEAAYQRAITIDAGRPEAYFDLGLLYQDHRGGDVESMRQAERYYQDFVARAQSAPALTPVVEAVTHSCPSSCGPAASTPRHRRAQTACTMGRLQQIREAICLLEAAGGA